MRVFDFSLHQFPISRTLLAIVALCAINVRESSILAADKDQNYLVGRAITDITGPAVGIKMLGYVRPDQITQGIHLRQYARAFVIAEPNSDRRVAIVTTDLMSVTHSLVQSVLDELRKEFGDTYRLENVVIAATHSHAVPGGYWQYGSDTPLGAPFNPEHYRALVDGIAASIRAAHQDLRPGRITIGVSEVEAAGAQRSRFAYLRNPEAERARYRWDVDREMTLLKFEAGGQPIGVLSWYPVHPTSMSFHNRLISADNKGYAAYAFEREQGAHRPQPGPFVAAFAQSNCGDVTPNLNLNQTGPGQDEFDSTRIIGQRQADAARRIFESTGDELRGPIAFRQAYVNFAGLEVSGEFTGHGTQRTFPAAYGYSFAAGSTEDGGGQPMFKEGMTRDDPLIETLAKAISPLPPPTGELRRSHRPKPILLAIGAADPPMLPHVLPVGVFRIGQLALVVGPAEFTTMSGRRFRDSVLKALPEVKHVVIAGYANDYAGYVATREEYEAQHYEGAATLFGPWTQAGYQQEFARLAADIAADRPSTSHEPPADVRGMARPIALGTPYDREPMGAKFGDVAQAVEGTAARGAQVTAAFWTGNPQNGYQRDRRYVFIERKVGDAWQTVAADGDWELKCRWTQPADEAAKDLSLKERRLLAHRLVVEWSVPKDAEPGEYRIRHAGSYKAQADGALHEFTAATAFRVE